MACGECIKKANIVVETNNKEMALENKALKNLNINYKEIGWVGRLSDFVYYVEDEQNIVKIVKKSEGEYSAFIEVNR